MICAKNEEINLKKNIPLWLSQKYKPFETLIVDDFSGIKTFNLVENLRKKDRYLKYYKVKTNIVGKKQAFIEGVSESCHNWLLLSDADCFPSSNSWLSCMIQRAEYENADIILGYSPYKLVNKSILNLWIHYEGWITGLNYLSFTTIGIPYMGVGRNLLYKKALINKNLIEKNADLVSGDDDLLVNQVANDKNTDICIHPDAFVYTNPKENWIDYIKQKRRHFSTSHRYKIKDKIILSAYSFSQILFYLCLVIMLVNSEFLPAIFFYLIRLLIISPVVIKTKAKLQAKFSFFAFLLLDFMQVLFYIIFSFAVLFPKKDNW